MLITNLVIFSSLCYIVALFLGITALLRIAVFINETAVIRFLSRKGAEKTWRGRTICWLRDWYYFVDSALNAIAYAVFIAIIGALLQASIH